MNLILPEPLAPAFMLPPTEIVAEIPGTPSGIIAIGNLSLASTSKLGEFPLIVYSHIPFASSFSCLSPDTVHSESLYLPSTFCFFSFGTSVYVISNPPTSIFV